MNTVFSSRLLTAIVVVIVFAVQVDLTSGQSSHWTNASGGDFNVAGNWSAGVPNSTVNAVFDLNATYDLMLTANENVNRFINDQDTIKLIGGYSITTSDSSRTLADLEILGTNTSLSVAGDFFVGSDATLILADSAELISANGIVADEATSTARVEIDHLDSVWQVDNLWIGTPDGINPGGSGEVDVFQGRITVGDNSVPTLGGEQLLLVGDTGTNGNVIIANGSVFGTNDPQTDLMRAILSYSATADSMLTVTGAGSKLTGKSLSVGSGGTSQVIVADGGRIEVVTIQHAVFATGNGSVTVTGAGSKVETDAFWHVGYSGTGSLLIKDGGEVVADSFSLGYFLPESVGSVTVTGIGSKLLGSSSLGSTITVGDAGTGSLFVEGGGIVDLDCSIGRDPESVGEVWVNGNGSKITGRVTVGYVSPDTAANLYVIGGGKLESDLVINESGFASIQDSDLFDSVLFDILDNYGQIEFTGTSFAEGRIINRALLQIHPLSNVVFAGDCINNGTMAIANGSNVLVVGVYEGAGSQAGNGNMVIEGGVNPYVYDGADPLPAKLEFSGNLQLDAACVTTIDIAGMAPNAFDRLEIGGNLLLDGDLEVIIDPAFTLSPGNFFNIISVAGNQTGQFNGLAEGDIVAVHSNRNLRISYHAGDGNDIALYTNPTGTDVVPTQVDLNRGTSSDLDPIRLAAAEGIDLSISRSSTDLQARTEFEVTAICPSPFIAAMEIKIDGSVFSRGAIAQTIFLFDYDSNSWVEVDTRNANRFSDRTDEIAISGNTNRFIEPGTRRMKAKVRFVSASQRQQFSSNTDQFIWVVED